ncbi:MAG: metallophosphoesterase family protein [Anaerolineae bacterium]|nr:metallophosphoesterase family protein [Anaerolineae bacterium]
MRLAVLADVHGNIPALRAVVDDMARRGVDGVVVAGDMTHGPHPVETINLLRSLGSRMICGNGDLDMVRFDAGDGPEAWWTHRQYALRRWEHRRFDRETLAFLKSLPEQLVVALPGAAPIRVVHGSPRSPFESIFPGSNVAEALAQVDEPVLVCGHTHVPWKYVRGERLALNPGAVCGALNGDASAQYALLDWGREDGRWHVEHRSVPYDLGLIRAAFRDSGLLEAGGPLARACLLNIETARNIVRDFFSYAHELAARAGFDGCAVIPDDIWEEAAATWNWDEVAWGDQATRELSMLQCDTTRG